MKNYTDIHIFVQRSCLHLLVCREAVDGISRMSSEKNCRTIFHNISSEEAAGFDYSSLYGTRTWIR